MKKWPLIALILIFAFSFYIRSVNIVPDVLVQFDPIFQLRMTQYIVDFGHLPIWDELTYYPGGPKTPTDSTFLWYITAWIFMILKGLGSNMSLVTTASWLSAFYGAVAVIPAYLLAREFSNEYGGLAAATLIATAPQILVRTFGGSFDTDQLVIFFILLSLYTVVMALKNRTIASVSIAVLALLAFAMTWPMFVYVPAIIGVFVFINFVLSVLFKPKDEKLDISSIIGDVQILAVVGALVASLGFILRRNVIYNFLNLFGLVVNIKSLIVNISIAELQPFSIFNASGIITALGNFQTGDILIDMIIILTFLGCIGFALWNSFKMKDIKILAFCITLLVLGVYTTFKGIRFTEFSSILFLTVVGIGFGRLIVFIKKHDIVIQNSIIGFVLLALVFSMMIGMSLGERLGPGESQAWADAWEWIRTSTPELSLIGTWWDPGHMISGTAERRNLADGAHCAPDTCFYSINERITDTGKIMATTNETLSVQLINKYKGNSPKAYWIASNDLIAKFQWCVYFGTGCSNCQLYVQLGKSNTMSDADGVIASKYGNVMVLERYDYPIPLLVQNRVANLPKEVLFYNGSVVTSQMLDAEIANSIKSNEEILGIRIEDNIIDYTVWLDKTGMVLVLIPPNLRDAVFTKMFMLEGQELEHFKQVFRNEEVKIYELV